MIKVIVTDIDGTFYDDNRYYDKKRFLKIFERLQNEDIHFVVASGNQHEMLHDLFDKNDRIHYISQNGAMIVANKKIILQNTLSTVQYEKSLSIIQDMPCFIVVSSSKCAYVLSSTNAKNMEAATTYFSNLKLIDNLNMVNEPVLKISLVFDPKVADEYEKILLQEIPKSLDIVSSGYGYIDIINAGCHKGFALEILLEKLQVDKEHVMVFGDQLNDSEILSMVRYPFVMENGSILLKTIYKNIAPSNNNQGVLEILEEFINDKELFLKKY